VYIYNEVIYIYGWGCVSKKSLRCMGMRGEKGGAMGEEDGERNI
jgi:hypothetical protein